MINMAETNLLKAIGNIFNNKNCDLSKTFVIKKQVMNRANNMGDALEFFIRDSFCNIFGEKNIGIKQKEYSENFSYLGNQNNPPDIILKNSDAIEVKKIDGVNASDLALNSSYPKAKLHANSPMITDSCRTCETWDEKDMIYAIGFVKDNKLKVLSFVYGDCYAANRSIYERIKQKVSNGLKEMDLGLSETKELGRVNKVDPLGITNLRIRGMWTIQNPLKVFSSIFSIKNDPDSFTLTSLMKKSKYLAFPKKDRELIESNSNLQVSEVQIQNPDNPANLLDAILIKGGF